MSEKQAPKANPGQAKPAPADNEDREHPQPAEEWGQRHETGKTIQRGGKAGGNVPGADNDQD